jgi:rhodanese-related sulfurtransferase
MFGSVEADELRALLERGAQLVEVLPEDEYAWGHLPGAVNIPLKTLTADAVAGLDRRRPVAVYCWDGL